MAFIVFEGIDGAGKSSLMNSLTQELSKRQIKYILTRQPGGTRLGEELRNILIRTEPPCPLKRTELFLYMADRAQHVEEVILPAIKNQTWVICDRYTASTLAFQAGGRSIQEDDINQLNSLATQNLLPDLFVLLDLPVSESAKRISKRSQESGQGKDRFENEKNDFHERVRQKYLDLAQANPKQWLTLDATQSPESLLSLVIQEVTNRGLW